MNPNYLLQLRRSGAAQLHRIVTSQVALPGLLRRWKSLDSDMDILLALQKSQITLLWYAYTSDDKRQEVDILCRDYIFSAMNRMRHLLLSLDPLDLVDGCFFSSKADEKNRYSVSISARPPKRGTLAERMMNLIVQSQDNADLRHSLHAQLHLLFDVHILYKNVNSQV